MESRARKSGEGVPPPSDVVEAVSRLVAESSEAAVAARLGIGVQTVSRLRGGLAVRKGTLVLVQKELGLAS